MSKTALVIDDSKSARFALRKFLEGLGYVVDTADSAAEGLRMLANALPTVIMLDHIMPVTDGFELLKKLKTTPRTAVVPVIICSSNGGEQYEKAAIARGASHVLQKPPSTEKLTGMLNRLQNCIPDYSKPMPSLTPEDYALAATLVPGGLPQRSSSDAIDKLMATIPPQLIPTAHLPAKAPVVSEPPRITAPAPLLVAAAAPVPTPPPVIAPVSVAAPVAPPPPIKLLMVPSAVIEPRSMLPEITTRSESKAVPRSMPLDDLKLAHLPSAKPLPPLPVRPQASPLPPVVAAPEIKAMVAEPMIMATIPVEPASVTIAPVAIPAISAVPAEPAVAPASDFANTNVRNLHAQVASALHQATLSATTESERLPEAAAPYSDAMLSPNLMPMQSLLAGGDDMMTAGAMMRGDVDSRMARLTQDVFADMGALRAQLQSLQVQLVSEDRVRSISTESARVRTSALAASLEQHLSTLRSNLEAVLRAQNDRIQQVASSIRQIAAEEARRAVTKSVAEISQRTADTLVQSLAPHMSNLTTRK